MFRVELTSLVNLGSVRSTWASVITVRELRHGEVEALATVLRRAHLARQSRLSTKHVGFRRYCARAPTRRGGGAGDRFASSSLRSSISARYEARGLPSLRCASSDTGRWRRWRPFRVELTSLVNLGSVQSTWASVVTVHELRHGEVEALATVLRRALRALPASAASSAQIEARGLL